MPKAINPKIAAARDFARKWGKDQVIIISVDLEGGTLEVDTYGETRALCEAARKLGDLAFETVRSAHVRAQEEEWRPTSPPRKTREEER